MLFEETLPPGTRSLYHLHHESDEVAWVIAGEMTFKIGDEVAVGGPGACVFMPRTVPHAWKNTGSDTAPVVFLYTPALRPVLHQRNGLFPPRKWKKAACARIDLSGIPDTVFDVPPLNRVDTIFGLVES